jgi:hypothetical protein
MIIANKKGIVAYVAATDVAAVKEAKEAYTSDGGDWDEIAKELVKEIQRAKHPAYGTDWSAWLKANIEELLQEAIGIVL